MHSNVTIKNVSWPHFSWATLYNAHIREAIENWREQMLIFVRMLIMLNDDILQTGCSRILPLLTV